MHASNQTLFTRFYIVNSRALNLECRNMMQCYHLSRFSICFKVVFVDPLDTHTAQLLKIVNELLHNSFPMR